jgi:amino acid transporter
MDFFASQERAEKQTRLMLGLFLLAVVCIVVALNLVGGLIFVFARNPYAPSIVQGLHAVPHKAYWITTAVVLGVIAFGSINRMSALVRAASSGRVAMWRSSACSMLLRKWPSRPASACRWCM